VTDESGFSPGHVARRVAGKEIGLFFASPVAWLFLFTFAALTLFVFFWVESWFARNIADVRPLFEWMPVLLIFLCAALTMRMWSEERRTGTLEHVLTQPAALWRFALGKFLACFALLLLALAATAPLPLTAALIADLDPGPVATGYAATALLGSTYIGAGLLVSARTDNAIVSLIGTVALCGALYLVGSDTLTGFFEDSTAEILRRLGSGSRFESIARGVVDFRDLFYYLSLTSIFLALNVYALEKERWANEARTSRHRHWRTATALLAANLLVANVWLDRVPLPRVDLTQGRLYSISGPTREVLDQLQEPLLIRGYFSARNHSMLAPLVPQLRDLMKEYALAGGGRVRVEFVDPAQAPELEREANDRFGIRAIPFQVADRHQAALVNAYFNILVQYAGEHQALGFTDMVEVRTATNGRAEVALRNPEYDITRAIRDVLHSYRSGGDLFATIEKPVEFIAYLSGDHLLPDRQLAYRDAMVATLQQVSQRAGDRFSFRIVEPEARGGVVARQIEEQWGFTPMADPLDGEREFFFYLTLADQRQVVQLPTGDFDPGDFESALDAGLRRFATGLTRTVALAAPPVDPQMARQHLGAPTFYNLEQAITRDYSIVMEDLADGSVDPTADILAVAAPRALDEAAVFAIDQFLMRGGTVILSTSPFTAELSGGELRLQPWDSGLQAWLQHNGIEIEPTLVLDEKATAFPTPVRRESGGEQFSEARVIDLPYLVDVRGEGLARDHPVTGSLPQVTMGWSSPVTVRRGERKVTSLLRSSPRAWTSDSVDIMPIVDSGGEIHFPGTDEPRRSHALGAVLEGRFDSFFAGRGVPEAVGQESLLRRSPESARIVLFASNDFMDDQLLQATVAAAGTQYLGPLELFMNTVDWALQDGQLLRIRSAGHFNRTLPPMEPKTQAMLEYFNYGIAIGWLLLLALASWVVKSLRRRRFAREFTP